MRNPGHVDVVAAVKDRYGSHIDLDRSPTTIIDIIRNFRHLLDHVAGEDGSGGAPGGGPTPPPPPPPGGGDTGGGGGAPGSPDPREVGTATVLNLLLELKREVRELSEKVTSQR